MSTQTSEELREVAEALSGALQLASRENATLKRHVDVLALASRNMLEAWDNKTPLAWQPENNPELLEKLRSALLSVDEAKKGHP